MSDLPRRFARYVLLRRVAKGGMGEVMLAATLGLEGAERPLIIKTIRAEHKTDKSFNARFLDEARVQAQLEHTGVAQVLEATTDDETQEPYVVVEYVDGRSLGDVRARALTSGQRLEWHEAVAISQLAAEALAHVHERMDAQNRPLSIVHRDLSPQNLMVSYGGDVKIIDFGTARGENRRCHTVSGVVFAKPGYVAPEVANGNPGDYRVDLYALGVMLWELCAGRRFLQGEASDHMAAVSRNERNLPPIADVAGAPRALDDIIARLTAFDREARYARTKIAARDLASLLGSSPPLSGGDRGVRPRIAALMNRLFEGDSAKNRREFLRLVAEARKIFHPSGKTPQAPTPRAALAMKEEHEGLVAGTRYRVVREIARGSGTLVVEAEHTELGRRVAVKMTDPGQGGGAEVGARLVREAKILSALDVPGVVRVLDVGRASDTRPFVVLGLCDGETLEARLAREPALEVGEALGIAARLLEVLERVHARGIIHRDVKPSNILLGEGGQPCFVDFGIAHVKGDLGEGLSGLDTPAPKGKTVALYGTPEYMAPEQAARPAEVDARADVYAVGAMLYEMLTGRLPFVGNSAVALLEAKSQGSPEAPSERAPTRGIPPIVDAICLRALARHATLRYASAKDMHAALVEAMSAPTRRRAGRRRAGFVALGAAMACALGLGGVAAAQYPAEVTSALGVELPWGPKPTVAAARPASAPEPAAVTAAPAAPQPVAIEAPEPPPSLDRVAELPEPPFDATIGDAQPRAEVAAKPERKKPRRADTKKSEPRKKPGKRKTKQ
ncbi:MAG: serine/threonine protein kinase [Polyangiaceae bacterium]|nr:serine/threonine protein kinase [Polyangiaceae bacterium]